MANNPSPETFIIECNRKLASEEYPNMNILNHEWSNIINPPFQVKQGDEIKVSNTFINEIGASSDILIFNNTDDDGTLSVKYVTQDVVEASMSGGATQGAETTTASGNFAYNNQGALIVKAAEIMLKAEHNYIDKMFELGDIENLKAYDLKQFISKRLNEKLVELGYGDKREYFKFDKSAASNLDWFYHLTGGLTHTDFFAVRPTDYSKANEGEDFEDIW